MCVLVRTAEAQDRRDWQSLAQLKTGDKIRLTLKTGPVEGVFQGWTPQQVPAATVIAKKRGRAQDGAVPSRRQGTGEHATIGALIGFGGGFVNQYGSSAEN
jgi:hypothetical protein